MFKSDFSEYLRASNVEGSGKADSYIKALEHLGSMLKISAFGFDDCIDIFNVRSGERLDELLELVQQEQQKGQDSIWLSKEVPQSYLLNGFCAAAIRSYQYFLTEWAQENQLFTVYKEHSGSTEELVQKLNVEPETASFFDRKMTETEGLEIVRKVKVRLNQRIFRKMILDMYSNTCCISGLNIPQLNIASHIIPWSVDAGKRLDPTNGLCLSATYDKAFDQGLISLDDDYRILVAKSIRDYYANEVVVGYFQSLEGQTIALPAKYRPSLSYLSLHRASGNF